MQKHMSKGILRRFSRTSHSDDADDESLMKAVPEGETSHLFFATQQNKYGFFEAKIAFFRGFTAIGPGLCPDRPAATPINL